MSVLAPFLRQSLMQVIHWPILTIQGWLDCIPSDENPDRYRFVRLRQAEDRLATRPNEGIRHRVETQREKRAREISRWHAMVNCSVACMALIMLAWQIHGTWVQALAQWSPFAPWMLVVAAALPFGYHVFVGIPSHDWVEWPELAEELAKKQIPAYLRGSPRDPDCRLGA